MSAATTLPYDAWAVAAPGLEPLVAGELARLGFTDARAEPGGVRFRCDAAGIARANLHSRLASRIVVRVASFRATAFHELERAARKVEWERFLAPAARFRVRASARKSRLYHSDAIAERVTAAVARRVAGATPAASGATDDDDDAASASSDAQLFVVRFERDRCTISADTSGALLHRRGYRQAIAKAPLRETLAAAMLAGAGWTPDEALLDPFCGSGTIVIEAAMQARGIAAGGARHFAAERWPTADAAAWRALRTAAAAAATAARLPAVPTPIVGSDRDAGAIAAARANAERAGVGADAVFSVRALSAAEPPAERGLLIANPPYGVRVSERGALRDLYARFGQVVRARFAGWRVAMLADDPTLIAHTGLAFVGRFRTANGGIPVRLFVADPA